MQEKVSYYGYVEPSMSLSLFWVPIISVKVNIQSNISKKKRGLGPNTFQRLSQNSDFNFRIVELCFETQISVQEPQKCYFHIFFIHSCEIVSNSLLYHLCSNLFEINSSNLMSSKRKPQSHPFMKHPSIPYLQEHNNTLRTLHVSLSVL